MKSIQTLSEYQQLFDIVSEAEDCLDSAMQTGIHYNLAWILRGYGLVATDRQETVRMGKRLLEDYEFNLVRE